MATAASSDVERASGRDRALANVVDVAVSLMFLLPQLRRLRDGSRGSEPAPQRLPWLRLLGPSGSFVQEQLASPGQLIAGVRTVDARTGRRLALWRSAVLLAAELGAAIANKRLAPPRPDPQAMRRFHAEVARLRARHRDDEPEAFQAAMLELYSQEHPGPVTVQVNLLRVVLAPAVTTIALRRVRRTLAPTIVVASWSRGSHSP